ncbi:MAG: gamma-glutamyl-gamma-aminobutyrate hydrolase family protein [Candidatus Eremiobacteraeota bacterium]|nr:gamma-glutamyl-gamma-aminobutyrate hydrolase family protein [Candidatus Eremiobacteraeota bacterium]
MPVKRPRILVTASRGHAASEYLQALRDAAATPSLVVPGDAARAALDGAAGVVLTGGIDVDPATYRAPASAFVTETEPERDILEIDVLRAARERGLPVLCICRGLQIANVAFRGTLIADIPQHLGAAAAFSHDVGEIGQHDGWRIVPEHVVDVEPDSALARITGATRFATNAAHHQAIDRCAGDLRIVARTADGIVEALEARFDTPFWLAVQWHPESTYATDDASRAIFTAFVDAAR